MVGLDRGNFAARVALFADAWRRGEPLPELSPATGGGEAFVRFNASPAACAAGAACAALEAAGVGREAATAAALRGAFAALDGLAALLAAWALRRAGLGRGPALVGAAVWALTWPRRGESLHAANLEHVAFLALLPLAGGLAAGVVRRPWRARRAAAGLGLTVAALVTCHPGLAVVHGAPLAALALGAAAVRHRRRPARLRRALAGLGLAAALGAAGAAWFLGPLLAERADFGQGVEVPGADPEATALDYLDRDLWFAAPGEGRAAVSPGNYLSSAYVGAVAVGLGALALGLRGGRRALAGGAAAWGLGCAVVSLQPGWTTALFGPVYGLAAVRFLGPAAAAATLAAALGAETAARRLGPAVGLRRGGVALALAGLVVLDLGTLPWPAAHLYAAAGGPPGAALRGGFVGATGASALWERLAAPDEGPAGDEAFAGRVLEVPQLELHEGLVVHGRPLADGLERHGWRRAAREALGRAREGVEAALAGEPPLDLTARLDLLAARWVVVVGAPAAPPALAGRALVVDLPRPVGEGLVAHDLLYAGAAPAPLATHEGGRVRTLEDGPARVRLAVEGPRGAVLVRRQYHRRWRAAYEAAPGAPAAAPAPLDVHEGQGGWTLVLVPGPGALTLTLAPWPLAGLARAVTLGAWLGGLLVALGGAPRAVAALRGAARALARRCARAAGRGSSPA